MYIKEVKKKNKGYDKTFIYHQLVESYRTEKGPRQRLLLDLGKLNLHKSKWKNLANRIEEIISGQTSLTQPDEEIEALAQHYASLLIHKRLDKEKSRPKAKKPDYQLVDINSVKNRQARTIGAEYISWVGLQKIGFPRLLKSLGFSEKEVKIAQLSIISRMVHPASENATVGWAQNISGIDELLNISLEKLSHTQLYRISDKLLEKKQEIEKGLNTREKNLFNLQEKIILYDLTNTYFESTRVSELKQRGRSKEKRHDMPLVTLGLVLDEEGFPKQSHLFPGNISEPGTLASILKKIDSKSSKLIILDAGIATKENLSLIRKQGHDYLVVARNRPHFEVKEEDFVKLRHDQQNQVEAYMYRDEKELYLYCRSALKGKKEKSMLEFHRLRFEEELKNAAESLHKKKGTKSYPKVLERIGRIKERHSRVSYFYDIEVKEQDGKATEITWKLKDERMMNERFSGSYYLRTNRLDLSEEEIFNLYITLTDVEDSFRSMKSELGLRPNFHQKDSRIEGHIFITVLAYHALISLQKYFHKQDIYHRWSTIRELLSVQQRITTEIKRKDGKMIFLRQTTEPEPFHYLISRALGVKAKPLGLKKQII